MKKLTWALLSLVLFFGWGAASAQTLPTPTFKPASGTAVPPGAKINITLPASITDISDYMSFVVLYVENNDEVALQAESVQALALAAAEDMGMGGMEDPDPDRVWKTASMDTDEDAETYGMWLSNVKVSKTATGTVKLRMRMAAVAYSDFEILYSDEFTATYTIDPNAVIRPDAPTFTLADNKLYMEHGYGEDDRFHMIYYKVNGTDADFAGITNYNQLESRTDLLAYEGGIAYTEGQTVKAVTVELVDFMTTEIALSNVATYPEPAEPAEPQTLPTPSFANVGEVTQGEALDITWPADLDLEKYLNWGFILYVENDAATELKLAEGATVSDLLELMMSGGGGVSPFAEKAAGTSAPAFKIAYYDGDYDDWTPAVTLSQIGSVTVRARLAAGKSQEDDPLIYSDEFTATYTVKERPKPTAPTFLVNGEEVEGASVQVESGAEVGFTNGYSGEDAEEYMIFYVINGTDADFETVDMTNFWFQDKVKMYIAGDELDGEFAVTESQTVKAATGQIMSDGSLFWSDIITVAFTIKGGDVPDPSVTVARPVITPDNSVGVIKLNQKVTITCATNGASIYYTLDGSVPTNASTLYTAPFLLPEGTEVGDEITVRAIAFKDGAYSDPARVNLMVEEAGDVPDPDDPTPVAKPNAPKFEVNGTAVTAATLAVNATEVEVKWIGDETNEEDGAVVYTLDGSEDVFEATNAFDASLYEENVNWWYFGDEAIDITVPTTIKARVAISNKVGDITWSDMVTLSLTFAEATPVELTFDPASGSEVEENTSVTITANQAVEIFYMLFESEEAAKSAAWDQDKADSYNDELKPVLSASKNTLKVACARAGSETLESEFFYATYKVKVQPDITLTFNPASGSEVKEGTKITVTASRETEIFYNVYADKASADADETFMANAKEVQEDGMPVITKEATYLRCAVSDKGQMKYFDATYKIETANEDLELAGVSVYPNPSDGMFNIELPVAATVEVFMSNGMLYQRLTLGEGNATLNIERSGIYFLRITGEGRTAIKRVIVR